MSHLSEDYYRVSGTGGCDNDRIRRYMAPSVSPHVIPSSGTMDTPLLEPTTAHFSQILAGSHVWTSKSLLMTQATDIFTLTLPFRPNTTTEDSPIFLPFPSLGCPSKAEIDRLPQLPRDWSTSNTDSGSNPNSLFHQPSILFPQPQSHSSHPLQTQTQPKLAFKNLGFAQATTRMASTHVSHAGPSQQYHSPYPRLNGSTPAHYVPQHPGSAPPPPPQQVQQVEHHPNDPRNEFIVSAQYRLESSGHLLGTGIINAVPAANGDVIFSRVVELVNKQASDLSRDVSLPFPPDLRRVTNGCIHPVLRPRLGDGRLRRHHSRNSLLPSDSPHTRVQPSRNSLRINRHHGEFGC